MRTVPYGCAKTSKEAALLYTGTGAVLWVAVAVMGLVGMGGVGLFLSGLVKLLPDPGIASPPMGAMAMAQGAGQFLGTFPVQMLLGPHLENVVLAGCALMVLGLLGTVLLAFCRLR